MTFVPDVAPEMFPADLRYAVTAPDGRTCRTVNIFHKLVHSPAVFAATAEATATTLRDLKLSPLLRELAICTVTRLTGASYPHHQHLLLSRRMGVDEAKLQALAVYEDDPAFSEEERAVMAFAQELTEQSKISPAVKSRIASFLDYQERVELAWTVGFYNAVSRMTSACDVEIEPVRPEGVALRR